MSNTAQTYRGMRMPTDAEAVLAVDSSRLLAARVGQGESAQLRRCDGAGFGNPNAGRYPEH